MPCRGFIFIFILLCGLAASSAQASSDVVNDPTYWLQDPALQAAIKSSGSSAVVQRIKATIESGAEQLSSGKWQPTEEQGLALAEAIRWAVILGLKDQLAALDTIANAPLGNVRANWHYALTYNGRWAVWLIRTGGQSPQQRVDDLIVVWRDAGSSIDERSFSEDRLVEDPHATETLVALTVEEILPRAGTYKGGVLQIADAEAAAELSRLETILAAKAQRSDRDRAIIIEGLSGTALEGVID